MSRLKSISGTVILGLFYFVIWKLVNIETVLCIGLASIVIGLSLIEEKITKL